MKRRDFNKTVAVTLLGTAALPLSGSIGNTGGLIGDTGPSYETLVANTWRHSDRRISKKGGIMRELVRYATLAANSHNTQPWKFRIETNRIRILPDLNRRCSAVDPDDHHLFVSLGCATENLVLAAQAHGLHAHVSMKCTSDAVQVDFEPTVLSKSQLFQAIPKRQCTRASYDGRQVPTDQLAVLEAKAQDNEVAVQMFTDKRDLEEILEYVVAGNSQQMEAPAFVNELKEWIRFSESAAVRYRDGLFTASSGNPKLPNWMGNFLFKLAFKTDSENDKYRNQIRSSSGVIAFVSEHNSKDNWVTVGRCYQRFALQATALGLRHAFINQAVEVPAVRTQFAEYLNVGDRRPDLLVRFGYGPELPRSLRRPVSEVISRDNTD